ncbi:MAG: aminotransferase class I/II-fold pyridoxal phosphate-dependent enzyme [Bacteroidota bacterium]
MDKKILLSPPYFSGEEEHFFKSAVQNDWSGTNTNSTDRFEAVLKAYLECEYVVALNSGTAGIHLALKILGVNNGDEVICSTFTFVASCNPIVYQGATPILVDSEEETWNMDPEILEYAIRERIAKGKKPKAIVLVHLYGMPAKLEKILSIASRYDIPIIEDAAEALGSEYRGQKLGTFGDIGIFSFNENKIITTGGGGALVCSNDEYAIKARHLSNQAREQAPHYEHSKIGYNYRMNNLAAAVGCAQMAFLKKRIARKREIFHYYKENLGSTGRYILLNEPNQCISNRWLSTVIVDSEKNEIDPETVRLKLAASEIESRPLCKPMHLQPIYRDVPYYGNGISESLFNKGLCLPSGVGLLNKELNRINELLEAILIGVT